MIAEGNYVAVYKDGGRLFDKGRVTGVVKDYVIIERDYAFHSKVFKIQKTDEDLGKKIPEEKKLIGKKVSLHNTWQSYQFVIQDAFSNNGELFLVSENGRGYRTNAFDEFEISDAFSVIDKRDHISRGDVLRITVGDIVVEGEAQYTSFKTDKIIRLEEVTVIREAIDKLERVS